MQSVERQEMTELIIKDVRMFKATIAAMQSLSAAGLLGYEVDGGSELPSFPIEIDGVSTEAYIDGCTMDKYAIENVIIYFYRTINGIETYCAAVVYPQNYKTEWVVGPKILTEDMNEELQFANLEFRDRLKELDD